MASVIYTANGTSQRTAASTTDKVRIATTGSSIAVATGNSSVTANLTACMIIPANTVERDFYVGQGNYIAFIVSGSDAPISITNLGAPHANTGTQ